MLFLIESTHLDILEVSLLAGSGVDDNTHKSAVRKFTCRRPRIASYQPELVEETAWWSCDVSLW